MVEFELISRDIAARLGLRRWVLGALAGSLVINVLLAGTILMKSETTTTVLVPMSLASSPDLQITNTHVTSEYLQLVARDLLTLVTYNTPANVDSHRDALMKYVSPASFGAIDAELLRQARHIKDKRASLLFDVQEVEVDLNGLSVAFTGIRRTLIGQRETQTERLTYRLTLTLAGGRLYLQSITVSNARGQELPSS